MEGGGTGPAGEEEETLHRCTCTLTRYVELQMSKKPTISPCFSTLYPMDIALRSGFQGKRHSSSQDPKCTVSLPFASRIKIYVCKNKDADLQNNYFALNLALTYVPYRWTKNSSACSTSVKQVQSSSLAKWCILSTSVILCTCLTVESTVYVKDSQTILRLLSDGGCEEPRNAYSCKIHDLA